MSQADLFVQPAPDWEGPHNTADCLHGSSLGRVAYTNHGFHVLLCILLGLQIDSCTD